MAIHHAEALDAAVAQAAKPFQAGDSASLVAPDSNNAIHAMTQKNLAGSGETLATKFAALDITMNDAGIAPTQVARNLSGDTTSLASADTKSQPNIIHLDMGDGVVHNYMEKPKADGSGSELVPVEKSADGKHWVDQDGKVVADRDPYESYTGPDGKEHFQKIVAFDMGGGNIQHYVERPDASGNSTLEPVEKSKDGKHWVMSDGTIVGEVDQNEGSNTNGGTGAPNDAGGFNPNQPIYPFSMGPDRDTPPGGGAGHWENGVYWAPIGGGVELPIRRTPNGWQAPPGWHYSETWGWQYRGN
jgi:hypothetical protein